MKRHTSLLIGIAAIVGLCMAETSSTPWPASDVIAPEALAKQLEQPKPPMIISVAFPVLYRSRHILHALQAGPGRSPEGLEALKTAVAGAPKGSEVVIYCGCCPMDKCPNIRPAYQTLKELGFTHIRVLNIPVNMHTDWYEKGYPSEGGSGEGV